MHFSAVYKLRRYVMAFCRQGASNKAWVGKISSFLYLTVNISKTLQQIRLKLLLMTNMKSHMGFPLTPRSTTLDDFELL